MDYSTSGGKIDDIKSKVDDFKAKIIAGTIKVPDHAELSQLPAWSVPRHGARAVDGPEVTH